MKNLNYKQHEQDLSLKIFKLGGGPSAAPEATEAPVAKTETAEALKSLSANVKNTADKVKPNTDTLKTAEAEQRQAETVEAENLLARASETKNEKPGVKTPEEPAATDIAQGKKGVLASLAGLRNFFAKNQAATTLASVYDASGEQFGNSADSLNAQIQAMEAMQA